MFTKQQNNNFYWIKDDYRHLQADTDAYILFFRFRGFFKKRFFAFFFCRSNFHGPVNHAIPWVALLPWNSVFAVNRLKLWKFKMQFHMQFFHRILDNFEGQKVIQSHFRLFLWSLGPSEIGWGRTRVLTICEFYSIFQFQMPRWPSKTAKSKLNFFLSTYSHSLYDKKKS